MNNITIKYNLIEYNDSLTLNVGSDRTVLTINVGVNGDYNCNDFELISTSDWISFKRIRNIVDVIIEPNNDEIRDDTILFVHKLNRAIKFELTIEQTTPDYSIFVSDYDNISYTKNLLLDGDEAFSQLTAKTDNDKTEKLIRIKCLNGKPIISATKQYAQISEDDEFTIVKYDNGLGLYLVNDNVLKITNFGKANLFHDYYYVVTLRNKNSIYNDATITIKYNKEIDNFSIA